MTDLRKAAEQALEALKDTHYRIIDAGLLDQDLLNRNFTVATALRQALAQEVTGEVTGDVDETAKGEQEPVGFFSINDYGSWEENENGYGTPLYETPPKREWVGLTGADKQEAFDETQEASGGFWEFADYLEAKLKEKNT